MTIYERSRYENSAVERIVATDGLARLTVLPPPPDTSTFQYSYYTVKDGERIDQLAQRFLADGELWWVIADHNPEWLWYEDLPTGLILRIPDVQHR